MCVIVTDDDNNVIACIRTEENTNSILKNGYKAFMDEEPIFTETGKGIIYNEKQKIGNITYTHFN